jgi:hypothetical protein
MDSLSATPSTPPDWPHRLPSWAFSRDRESSDHGEVDAAFSAGIALKSLDDLVRSEPAWAGCWRSRQALKCAVVAARLMGRTEDEHALRDAVLLTAADDDPGPAGNLFLAMQRVSGRTAGVRTEFVEELAGCFALRWDHALASVPDLIDATLQSGRAAPFAAADLIDAICAVRPDAEVLTFVLADLVLAKRLNWPKPIPLLLSERYGPAFRTIGGRGRVRPGEPAFAGAICLALVEAIDSALQSAMEIARRADQLLLAAPKLRTKGAEPVIRRLLQVDAVLASAPGTNLSRWASTRMFDRLQSLGALRELSGRSSFRIYGL